MPTRLTQTGAEVQEDLYKIEDIDLATEEKAGLMSPEDKTKLDNIDAEIPTKLSDLEDDSTHRTVTDAEKTTWNNKSDFDGRYDSLIGRPYIPQRTSDLRNDSGFITNVVNNLVNYYLKSETYSKAEVQDLIAAVQGVSFVIADELPTASADTMGKIYLVPSADPQTANIKDEYITIDNGESAETRYTWEQIGSTAVNLEGYVTTEALNTALSAYTTTTDLNTLLAGKQDKIDADHKLSYTLLTDTPTIPDAQIQSDWNQSDDTKKDFIKNKPTIPTVTGKADKVSGAVNGNFAGLDSNGNLTDSGKKASDFATSTQGGKADTAYQKPSGGIPSSDMTEAVQTSLGKADTALQSFTETDPTVPSWAKASSKPSYTAAEVGALPDDTEIPSALSDLSADSTHRLVTDTEKATWNSKQDAISDLETIRSGAAAGATAYQKPATGIPASDIAAGVIPDVSNFITKSVNDLVNYYTKSETYTQTEVNNLIGAIQQFHYEIVATLPASGAANILYLLGPTGSGADKYEEYVYANNAWVKIGDTSIDLSGYYQKPAGGIPASDLASAVQTSLGLADTAVQPEAGKGLFSGNYNDLSNKPTIPTVEALTTGEIDTIWNTAMA